jgi:acetyltransferase-like isoleucine patch superfamily enzyme
MLGKLQRIWSLSFYEKLNLAQLWYYRMKGKMFYRRVFKSFGKDSAIYPPTLIGNPQYITIGDRVTIRNGVRLEAVMLDPKNPPEIRIGNNVNIEQDVHIVAVGKVHIHDDVSITARVCLLGGTHPFFDIHNPVKIGNRLDGAESLLEIGEGSFLGVGCTLQMNVRLGKRVVVGSNSVVKKSFPDDCVVDGNPAAVVLQYNAEEGRWKRS